MRLVLFQQTTAMEGETDLVTELMDASWQRIVQVMRDTQSRLQLKETLCVGQKYASDHPVFTLSILLTTTMCCVPIMCFVAFAVGSALLTFATFLCIEGKHCMCACLPAYVHLSVRACIRDGHSAQRIAIL